MDIMLIYKNFIPVLKDSGEKITGYDYPRQIKAMIQSYVSVKKGLSGISRMAI